MSVRSFLRRALNPREVQYPELESSRSNQAPSIDVSRDLTPEVITESTKAKEVVDQKPARLENVTEIPEASAYVAHLATYPALAALNGLISSFPVPKIFASNGIPLLMYLRDNNQEQN